MDQAHPDSIKPGPSSKQGEVKVQAGMPTIKVNTRQHDWENEPVAWKTSKKTSAVLQVTHKNGEQVS